MPGQHQSIQHVDDVFRRLAFGCDPQSGADQSWIVALGLIVNYLDNKLSNRSNSENNGNSNGNSGNSNCNVIADIYAAELLRGADFDQRRYPRVHQFQKTMAKMLDLKADAACPWGKATAKKFNENWLRQYWVENYFVHCHYGGFGKDRAWEMITEEIEQDRPAMVTLDKLNVGGKTKRFVSLAVCGYRVGLTGRRELLVHPGHYGEGSVRGSRVQLAYVPLAQMVCSYQFRVLVKGVLQ